MDMLFMREFLVLYGGHVKYADYINHTKLSGLFNPVLWIRPESRSISENIFNEIECDRTDSLAPFPAYFIAGGDWEFLDRAGIVPGEGQVINLIQGVRHADRQLPLHSFLSRPALRICVSEAVADAIRPMANGEVVVIQNGLELGDTPKLRDLDAPVRVLVAGVKDPALAARLADRLAGQAKATLGASLGASIGATLGATLEIRLLLEHLPRDRFLAELANATIAVQIPLSVEGFYLPALETMLLGRGLVTMDCLGNRGFCSDGHNCLIASRDVDSLAEAVVRLAGDRDLLHRCAQAAHTTAQAYGLGRERAEYWAVLRRWAKGFA